MRCCCKTCEQLERKSAVWTPEVRGESLACEVNKNKTGNVGITQYRAGFEKHSSRGKEVCYILICVRACVSVSGLLCVSMGVRAFSLAYPACNAYAPYCVICGFFGFTIFFDIISYTVLFSEKGY